MTRRQVAVRGRPEFRPALVGQPPFRSRAKEIVGSGLDRCAAQIAELTHSLTDSAMQAMETEISEQGGDIAMSDVRLLRSAVFAGIGRNIIDRIDRKLGEMNQ